MDSLLEQTNRALALAQRNKERKTEPKASELMGVISLINEGSLDDKYWNFAYHPTNKSEHMKLTPQFKAVNQDLDTLDKILGMDKSKLKALENQADEWWSYAHKVGTTDTSRPIIYQGRQYTYPSREIDAEKKFIADIEAKGEKIISSLNQVARSEPQIFDEASKRLNAIRTVLKVPQSYEEIQQGLPPIEKPAVDFISDLRHAEQDMRYRAKRVLVEAGIDGEAINKESDTFDPRTGRPLIKDEADKMMAEAKAGNTQGVATSPGKP